ncbi:MAG TPA: Maf family protein [Myxococcaceae bacterium]|nr:Maf family protein [Myxococcaceae bacterium]
MRETRSALVLASGSPRRRELLERLGFQLEIVPPEVDESPREGEDPRDYVLRLAREKAERVSTRREAWLVLAADTSVVLGAEILGKPRDGAEAAAMLARLSGRDHRVLTGVATAVAGSAEAVAVETRVHFRSLTEEEIRWYVESGEPLDKAGAYAIQGLGATFVRAIEGSVSNVVGLPLVETLELLAARGCWLPWMKR